jgi:hypothetical protein
MSLHLHAVSEANHIESQSVQQAFEPATFWKEFYGAKLTSAATTFTSFSLFMESDAVKIGRYVQRFGGIRCVHLQSR